MIGRILNVLPGEYYSSMNRPGFYARHGKRWFDGTASLAALMVLAVPLCLIGLWVWASDGQPILFRQERVGRHGRLFRICKFRTMNPTARPGTTITVADDPRITKTGKWLRRLKLDELPQLINVLQGDMSLVGPRPDVPGYADQLTGQAAGLLELRPGITGPATLAFRNEEALLARVSDPKKYNDEVIFPEKVRLNLEYARTLSLGNDVRYIVKTIFAP
jgi:lipopolysaccharide/colanic/teichoic acid biosynthesis glycosyltransferase